MAIRNVNFADLKDGEEVTLRLREGESIIVGTVAPGFTTQGGRHIDLKNNRNHVVIYRDTNFRIFADRHPTIREVLAGYPVGTVFSYRNKHEKTLTWVKSGDDRVTRVDDDRPAYSLSISAGFTDLGDNPYDRISLVPAVEFYDVSFGASGTYDRPWF